MLITGAYTITHKPPLEKEKGKKPRELCALSCSSSFCLFLGIIQRLSRGFQVFSIYTALNSLTSYTPILLYGKMSPDVEWHADLSAASNWHSFWWMKLWWGTTISYSARQLLGIPWRISDDSFGMLEWGTPRPPDTTLRLVVGEYSWEFGVSSCGCVVKVCRQYINASGVLRSAG